MAAERLYAPHRKLVLSYFHSVPGFKHQYSHIVHSAHLMSVTLQAAVTPMSNSGVVVSSTGVLSYTGT